MALPVFARRTPLLLSVVQQSIDISCGPMLGQTDRRTDDRQMHCIDPARHYYAGGANNNEPELTFSYNVVVQCMYNVT